MEHFLEAMTLKHTHPPRNLVSLGYEQGLGFGVFPKTRPQMCCIQVRFTTEFLKDISIP